MVISEVVCMWKKITLFLCALLLVLSANLNICWKVSVGNMLLPGFYSSSQLRKSSRLASAAAEEISSGESTVPECAKKLHLSFHPPCGDCRTLSGALLENSSGVALSDGVFVNGTALGTVQDGSVLYDELRSYIRNQMPNAAVFGSISGRMQIRPVYSRPGHETGYNDMVLLVSGMAPVFYVDKNGKLA